MNRNDERSVSDVLQDIFGNVQEIVRSEVRLARAETVESLMAMKRGAVWLGIGIAVALCAAAAGVAFLIIVLSEYALDGRTWLAALIVSLVLGVIAWICVWRGGHALSGSSLAPHETATSIKETAAWLRHPTRSVVR